MSGNLSAGIDRLSLGRWYAPCTGVLRMPLARIVILVFSLLYAYMLDWLYRTYSVPRFGYMGYELHPHGAATSVGYFFTGVSAVLLPTGIRRPGTGMVWILFVLAFVPIQSIIPISLQRPALEIIALQFSVAVGFLSICISNMLPPVVIPVVWRQRWLFYALFAAAAASIYAVLLASLGIPKTLPTFGAAYDTRFELRETMATTNPLVAYLWLWLGKVINPLIMVFGATRRRWPLFVAGFTGQVYLYAMSGAKSVLMSAMLVLVLIFLLKWCPRRFGMLFAIGGPLVLAASRLLDMVLSTPWFSGLFVQRLLILPGILSGYYFDFFSDNPQTRLGHSVLSGFYSYPYEATIAFVVGQYFYGNELTQANANFWADGFANFGIAGVLLVSVLAALLVWTFNSLGVGRDFTVLSVLAGFAAFSLASSSIFNSMLSHGIALSLVFALLLPSDTIRSHRAWRT